MQRACDMPAGPTADQDRCDLQWRVSTGPLTDTVARANALAAERIGAHAKRVGVARRAFLQSLCGAATTLLTLDQAFAARGNGGGRFRAAQGGGVRDRGRRTRSPATSSSSTSRPTWSIRPARGGPTPAATGSRSSPRFPQGSCGDRDPVDCFSAEQFIKHVFLDSDTDLAVLSFVPELPEHNPLSLEEAERVRVLVERMEGAHRLFLHAMVVPNGGPEIAPLELMEDAVARYPIAAWKCYTQWGPDGVGWELDSPDVGHPVHRAGAGARRPQHLHPQGPAVLRLSGGVRPLRRRRPGRPAVPGHELHHLPLGLRGRPSRRVRSIPQRRAGRRRR